MYFSHVDTLTHSMQMGPVFSLFLCLRQSDFLCWRRERQTEILWSHARDSTHKPTFMTRWELCPHFKRSVWQICVSMSRQPLALAGRNNLHEDGVLFFLPQDSGSKQGFTHNVINAEVMSPNSPGTTPLPLIDIYPCYDFNAVSTLSGIWFWWRKCKKKAIFKYAEVEKNIRISLWTAIMWNLCVPVSDMSTPSSTSPLFFSLFLPLSALLISIFACSIAKGSGCRIFWLINPQNNCLTQQWGAQTQQNQQQGPPSRWLSLNWSPTGGAMDPGLSAGGPIITI